MGDGTERRPEQRRTTGAPLEETVVASQGRKIEAKGQPPEAVLAGVPSDAQLLTGARDAQVRRLADAGVGIDPNTGYPEELTSSTQVRNMIRGGVHPFFASERLAEVTDAIRKRDDIVTTGLVNRNLREHTHYVAAAGEIQTDLNAVRTNLT